MNFKRFLNYCKDWDACEDGTWTSPWSKRKKVLVVGEGSEAVRSYVVSQIKKMLNCSSSPVYFLHEIRDSMWQLLSDNFAPIRLLMWQKGLMSQEEAENLLIDLFEMEGKTIIEDNSSELHKIASDEKGRGWSRFLFIDCRVASSSPLKKDKSLEQMYAYWLTDVENQVSLSPRLLDHFVQSPLLESFNTIKGLSFLGEKEFNLLSAKKWGLLWVDRERELLHKLLGTGRGAAKKENWRDINTERFFFMLMRELGLLLQVKTMPFGRRETTRLSPQALVRLRGLAKKQTLRELYKRLYLVSGLMKWRYHKSSVGLLLLYW